MGSSKKLGVINDAFHDVPSALRAMGHPGDLTASTHLKTLSRFRVASYESTRLWRPVTKLTPFEHVLLGMIFIHPSSGYDLKRRFATSPMGVYQPSSGALYPALERLERRGLLRSEALQRRGKERRPGRALGGDYEIRRGRPHPGHRLFGQATSRTRAPDATPAAGYREACSAGDSRHTASTRRRYQRPTGRTKLTPTSDGASSKAPRIRTS
jgi:hypothetical protein